MTDWEPYPDLDDEEAAAFGRMAWAAVKLEGVIDRICEEAVEGSTASGFVSDHVKVVRPFLAGLVANSQVAEAKQWLDAALRALDERNKLIHVTTQFWADVVDGKLLPTGTIKLVNLRKKKATLTDLTVGNFRKIQAHIDDAYQGWKQTEVTIILEKQAT